MALFDHTAARLARGPAVLFAADPADGMAEAILRYDPQAGVKSDSSWRVAAAGSSSRNIVRSSGAMLFSRAATSS